MIETRRFGVRAYPDPGILGNHLCRFVREVTPAENVSMRGIYRGDASAPQLNDFELGVRA